MSLARVIENRREKMVDKVVSAPNALPKGSQVTQVPKYTMLRLLFDADEDADIDDTVAPSDALSHLPTALL